VNLLPCELHYGEDSAPAADFAVYSVWWYRGPGEKKLCAEHAVGHVHTRPLTPSERKMIPGKVAGR